MIVLKVDKSETLSLLQTLDQYGDQVNVQRKMKLYLKKCSLFTHSGTMSFLKEILYICKPRLTRVLLVVAMFIWPSLGYD